MYIYLRSTKTTQNLTNIISNLNNLKLCILIEINNFKIAILLKNVLCRVSTYFNVFLKINQNSKN